MADAGDTADPPARDDQAIDPLAPGANG